jgi:hypothetical protein
MGTEASHWIFQDEVDDEGVRTVEYRTEYSYVYGVRVVIPQNEKNRSESRRREDMGGLRHRLNNGYAVALLPATCSRSLGGYQVPICHDPRCDGNLVGEYRCREDTG